MLEPVSIQLRWRHQFQFAGYYAAVEKGFYREAGLNVTLLEGGLGRNSIEEVVSGRVQYGVTNSEILLHRLNGKPLVVLAAIFQHSPLVLVARRSTGIISPQDLIGKRVKMTRNRRDVELHAMLAFEGVPLDRLAIFDSSPTRPEDFLDVNIQAVSAYLTNEPFYLEERGVPYNVINPINYGVDFYGDCLFTSEEELEKHPRRVKAFREATLRGWAYAMDHPEEIIAHIRDRYGSLKPEEHLLYEAKVMRELIVPELVELGHINPGRWDRIADIFMQLGWARDKERLKDFVYSPDPLNDMKRVRLAVTVSLVLVIVAGLIILALVAFNRRLQTEIREKQKTQEALRESEEKFSKVFQSDLVTVSIRDLETGVFVDMNDQVAELYGMPREEIIGRSLLDLGLLDLSRERHDQWVQALLKQRSMKNLELEYHKKSGEKGTILNSTEIIELGGRPHILSISQDITERKRSEEKLKAGEERLRAILEANPDPTVVYNGTGLTTYLNPAFSRVFGWTWEELKDRRIPFVPEDQRALSISMIKELYAEGRPIQFETRRLTRDGRTIDVVISAAAIKGPDGEAAGMVVNITDVTERKLLEAQLRHSQKMEALGTLTGGIAHDFNNLLQAISGFSQLIHTSPSADDKIRFQAEEIYNAAHRGADLVKRLLTFSRKVEPSLAPLDLNHEVEQAVLMLERIIPKMIGIETRLEPDLQPINGDSAHLEQLLLNLGVNARDAMPEGGKIVIETRTYEATGSEDISPALLAGGTYALLIFSDTGQGMDRETLERIFEPFFTTKKFGQGTGLGLASVYGIVKSHHGHITCESSPGEGTVFRLYFPEICLLETPAQPVAKARMMVLSGGETILLIDDEEPIRELVQEMLYRQGYQVLTAANGEEGVELFARNKEEIALVVLDLLMPGMGGQKTMEKLLELDPEVRVIIASGYSTPQEIRKVMSAGAAGFVAKPYRLGKLLKAVRETLDGTGAETA